MPKKNDIVICHYGEVGLKGKNRKFFEEKLIANIKQALPEGSFKNVKRISGRILVHLSDNCDESVVEQSLKTVFGLAYFAFAQQAEQNIESIGQRSVEMLESEDFETFRIDATRSNKDFALTSQQINEQAGGAVIDKFNKKVKLKNPDITLFVQIVEKFAFLFTKKIKSLGGLPVGTSSKAVSLLSGGIDSPVASFLVMKRGVEVVFLHLYTSDDSVGKVKQIIELLNKHQSSIMVYLAPFLDIQKAIFGLHNKELCCVLCKRFMMRIAESIAREEKALAIVTGENLAQVASQTLENMSVIEQAVVLPILRPVLTYDKQETIELAKKMGAYDVSILPEKSYCQGLLPKHPATKASLSKVLEQEKNLSVERLINKSIKNAKIWKIK